MHQAIYFILSTMTFFSALISCGEIIYNDSNPPLISQDFPLLNVHMPQHHITKIANIEGDKPWWGKIRRTAAYAACLEIEDLFMELHEAGRKQVNKARPHIIESHTTSCESDINQFTEEKLAPFLRERIALILGPNYHRGIHCNEYYALINTIITIKKNFIHRATEYQSYPPKKCQKNRSSLASNQPTYHSPAELLQ